MPVKFLFFKRAKSGLTAACIAMLAGCGLPLQRPSSQAHCRANEPVPWQAISPSVWIWLPEREAEIDIANAGHVAPTSVVVDRGEAMVIDPGPNHRHGLRVKQSVYCRFGARITWVINTHAHPENVMGNSAFADEQARGLVRIAASQATRDAMQQRCEDCLLSLRQRAGFATMQGTRIVWPDTSLLAGVKLRVGRRQIQVLDVVRAHTEGDVLLRDSASGLLWVGGLVYGRRIPELAQGSLQNWLQVLDRLNAPPVRDLVGMTWSSASGDGRAPPALQSTLQYLLDLRDGVLQAMEAGRLPSEADVVPLPAYAEWPGYQERHAFNVMRVWRELEPVWMEQVPPRQVK